MRKAPSPEASPAHSAGKSASPKSMRTPPARSTATPKGSPLMRTPSGDGIRVATTRASGATGADAYMHAKMKYHRALTGPPVTSPDEETWDGGSLGIWHPPAHVLPSAFFVRLPFDHGGQQGSLGFVFTVANTMMGSTVFLLPWGFCKAGILVGSLLTFIFTCISFYTCTLILRWAERPLSLQRLLPARSFGDFSDLCDYYIGSSTKRVAVATSVSIMSGAMACYHVLMATMLQGSIISAYARADLPRPDWLCCGTGSREYATSGVILGVAMMPMMSIRDITKLAQLAGFGSFALLFNVAFVIGTSSYTAMQLDRYDPRLIGSIKWVGTAEDAGVFVGMMGLSLFIHSVLLPIANNHVAAEVDGGKKVKRDLGLAYLMVGCIYVVVGAIPAGIYMLGQHVVPQYIGKSLPQNVMLSFPEDDVFALLGRLILVLQLATVYPMLGAVTRKQFFAVVSPDRSEPRRLHAHLFNAVLCVFTTLVCAAYPYPGSVVGYVGAYTAVVYMLALPLMVHVAALKGRGELRWPSAVGAGALFLGGSAMILSQFYL